MRLCEFYVGSDLICLEVPSHPNRRLCDAHLAAVVISLGVPTPRGMAAHLTPPSDFDTIMALAEGRNRWDGLTLEQLLLIRGQGPVL